MNHLRSLSPAVIFLTFLAIVALAGSAMYDGLPSVSAGSIAHPASSPHELNLFAALSEQDEPGIRGSVSPALADLPIEDLAVTDPVVLGKTTAMSLTVRNGGATPTGAYGLAFYFEPSDGGAHIETEDSDGTSGQYESVGAGDSDSQSLSIEVPGSGTLSVGAYNLCAQVQPVGSSSSTTEVGNPGCELVFVLPDMSDLFPDTLYPIDYESPVDEE